MAGNVVVDDVETEEPSPRVPVGWFAGLGAMVVLVLVLLPGQPDTASPTTTVAFPEAESPEERWSPLDLPGSGTLRDVVALPDGSYVAVGDGPQAWRYDGDRWEWVLGEAGDVGALRVVTAYRDGALAVGTAGGDDSLLEAAIWRSATGGDWRRVPVDVGRPAGLEGVYAAGGRAVAWGWAGSPRDFAPDARPLLLRSDDGETWSVVEAIRAEDRLARLFTVTHHQGTWYAGGYATGRPALWRSGPDMTSWERVETGGLPFGWSIFRLRVGEDGSEEATLVDLGESRARRWVHRGGSWEPLDQGPRPLVVAVPNEEESVGVGEGRLWIDEEGEWEGLDLAGQVAAASGRVAVGAGPGSQPRVWMQDGAATQTVEVEVSEGSRWEAIRDLGESGLVGAWRVADGWAIGGDGDEWWYLDGDGVETFSPSWQGSVSAIVPAGDEWVALPSMHWTSDGLTWEQRARPWAGGGTGASVEAVTEVDGTLLAVGRDSDYLWNVAASTNGGRSWTPIDQPMATDALSAVAGTPEGFVATAARSQGQQEVVASPNGRTWEPVTPGRLLSGAQLPSAVTEAGTLLLFDTAEEIRPPRPDIAALVRHGDDLVLVAGGRMWVGGEDWEEIPLDPPHGMGAGFAQPVPVGDRLLAVGADRGRLLLYRWDP